MRQIVIKLFDNRLFYLIVSLIAAFVLWLFVVNTVNPVRQTTLTFNIQYEGEGMLAYHNLRLASDTPRSINLRVEASAADMGRLTRNNNLIVDVSGLSEAGEHDVTYSLAAAVNLTGAVTHWPTDFQLSNAENSIIVRVNRVAGRHVTLSTGGITYTLAVGENEDYFYVARGESIEPEVVLIDGPEEVLDRIGRIDVVSDFGTELAETTTQGGTLRVYDKEGDVIPLEDLQDVTFFSHESIENVSIHVTVPVSMAKRVPLRPVFEYGAGANPDNVTFDLDQEDVWLIGEVEVLRGVEYVELAPIRLGRVEPIDVIERDITAPPLTEIHGGPDKVEIALEIQGIDEREMIISSDRVQFMAVGEDILPEVVVESLRIVVRGPAEDIEELDESEIMVLVNLADYSGRIGALTVGNISIRIGDWDPEEVGAMDLSGITVNLQRRS